MVSIREKNSSPIAEMKDSFKNSFPLDSKKALSGRSLWKKYKNWFVLARKYVPNLRNEAFVEKYVSMIPKTASSDKKIKENGSH